MPATVDIGTLIERRPGVRGGRPHIAGKGVAVRTIAVWHNMGLTPDEIAATYGHVSLGEVHAALAYYFSNRAEIDADIAAEEAETEEIRRKLRRQS